VSSSEQTPADATIRRVLQQADPMALRATIYQLTGDETLAAMELGAEPSLLGDLPAVTNSSAQAVIRAKAFAWLKTFLAGHREAPPPPPRARLQAMMPLCVGHEVSAEYVDLYLEELGLVGDERALEWQQRPPRTALESFHVLIIGAGIGGLCAAIRCEQAGIPYTVIEKNEGVGGTWFENTYPDARVDVPSHWYSYTFEIDYAWVHSFAPQAEIRGYLEYCARKYGVHSGIRFENEVMSARWEESESIWSVRVRSRDGDEEVLRANVIVSSVGMLNRPRMPEIEGLEDFEGPVFHTARWDHDCDLSGKRVAVIGTGASGMQLVPGIAPVADRLVIFQRSPGWVFSIPGYRDPLGPELAWLLENLPYYRNWLRLRIFSAFSDRACQFSEIDPNWTGPDSLSEANGMVRDRCIEYLRDKIGDDPELVRKCLPSYPPMSKRFIVDNGWFDALKRENVDLITDRIAKITAKQIVTESGREYPADVIVLATGFHADRYLWPMQIEGRSGARLEEVWGRDGARAYLGITVPGFPNLFCLYGPNTNPRAGHVCTMHELQMRYALGCIRLLIEGGYRSIDCRKEVHDEFNRRLDAHLSTTIWTDRRQESYYRNAKGRVTTNSPWRLLDYWRWTSKPDPDDYWLA